MYVCMYLCKYVCMYVYIYIYIYIYMPLLCTYTCVGIHVVCKLRIIKLTFQPTFSAKLAKEVFQVLTASLKNFIYSRILFRVGWQVVTDVSWELAASICRVCSVKEEYLLGLLILSGQQQQVILNRHDWFANCRGAVLFCSVCTSRIWID